MTEHEHEHETIRVERRGRVAWIQLDRPEALNALNTRLMHELVGTAKGLDADDSIGAIVITGSEKAFAAGADIKEMAGKSTAEMRASNHFGPWLEFASVQKPVIAAVSGYALGGGCELALMCDIILAADTAQFGLPEVGLGVIPGIGGTQRLVRAVGYPKAAEIILTGRRVGAEEAERIGLVSRVVPADALLDEAGKVAEGIAAKSLPALRAAKATMDAALEMPLAEGLAIEAEHFTGLFDTADQKEGMAAFSEKREPNFQHR
ncbi:enoyl-CoA hydratase-related protein [Agrococcus sp. HG114]|uniref:enoyl-CoA hydratase-related protein n=1 Tax=Agrococcus sp. HG114 TaxID=2969757 RepID=UPI00215AF240|nr:enoyl-CoA hydratase-related protein [Agrococcus sp. HG114]MCR8670563.1 enoyl-CoA hydratase-related protein [Agrococcus sp. HG114]